MCHHVANVSPPLSFTFLRGRSEEWEPVTRERETAASLPTHAWYGLPTADAVSREIEKWLGKTQRARWVCFPSVLLFHSHQHEPHLDVARRRGHTNETCA